MKARFSCASCHVFPRTDHPSDLFKRKLQPVENSSKQQGEKTCNSCLGPCQGAKFSHWIKPIFLLLSIASHCTTEGPLQTRRCAKHNTITPSQGGSQPWEIGMQPGLIAAGFTLSSQSCLGRSFFLLLLCWYCFQQHMDISEFW